MIKRDTFSSSLAGHTFRDREGQLWSVKGPRPGSSNQLVVEAEMKGSYPRVALYVMTEREFKDRAREVELRPEKPAASSRHA
jgi:hypothetical protein